MQIKKLLVGAIGVLAVGVLASCGGNDANAIVDKDYKIGAAGTLKAGYTSLENKKANKELDGSGSYKAGNIDFKLKNTFKTTYSTEPTDAKFNYLVNTWTYNSYHYCNMVEGLVSNDKYGNIVGDLALGYKVTENKDGTETWSFQIRENSEWVNNKTGKKYADVTAEDFVTSAKYVLDPVNGSGTASLYINFVNGASDYFEALAAYEEDPTKTKPDFASVGVKAVDKYIIEYTLPEPTPYFSSVLTYSPFLPANAAFIAEQGTDFGATVDGILVNSSFRITTHDYEVKMVYTKNYHYWDRNHVYVDHVERSFVPTTATYDTTRQWYEAGTIDSFTVNEQDETGWQNYVKGADNSGSLKTPAAANCNAIQSYGDATYIGYFNYNRTFYEFAADAHVTTDKERTDAVAALINRNFRKGILYGMDVIQYLKRFSSEEPYNYLMRSYTNKELNSVSGKDYTDFVADVYNREKGTTGVKLVGIDQGSDPIYNAEIGRDYFEVAYEELGTNVSYPIYLDYLGSRNTKLQVYEKAMLASLEASSKITVGETTVQMIKWNYNVPNSDDQNTKWGSVNSNFDFSMWSGWGPDYADPNTYLHTMCIYGDMVDYMGFPTSSAQLAKMELSKYAPKKYQDLVTGGANPDYKEAIKAFQQDILGEYDALYRAGAAITDPTKTKERFEAFAEAEYNLIYESAIIVPWYSQNGYYASVSNTVPWQAGRATYGLTVDKFKNVIVTSTAITKEQRAAVTAEYEAGK